MVSRTSRYVAPGSSPLARGLPPTPPLKSLVGGIIPARAGFTSWPGCTRWRAPDHPRSRGVYAMSTSICARPSGSSPLARGLRCRWLSPPRRSGIIPARAGFTCSPPPSRRGGRDHPRSRGVYNAGVDHIPAPAGSSPLARGLRNARPFHAVGRRIIPARAGFTRRCDLARRRTEDHPRSRGVYIQVAVQIVVAWGSSPLARGLPDYGVIRDEDLRIIPARAGFTESVGASRPICGDHPRSRGVYPRSISNSGVQVGSSPLARGLRSCS